jgi:hypothetical protein
MYLPLEAGAGLFQDGQRFGPVGNRPELDLML